MLVQKPILRQLLAGVLLMVFSFSIAPKKYLHDAIANHTDTIKLVSPDHGAQLNHVGFVCKCDNLVAESPFTDEVSYFSLAPANADSLQQSTALYHFYSTHVFFFELRGPPVPLV